ncbi:Rieske [2Fe-2S] domain protein [Sporothrix schenckii 1099-18]|uniref:Rieske domain-containing protein n=2 Tax=Sporothrix schenckii TaxID=29908 RepID=U7PID4_SPOS1|nr:Rieske [2Fe-2S] domain protein [Sporothrix schenckii 1099-18]ERS95302.1 hypothetical protein HMPREF1624_08180 [Sporothrix schenckii ATCC 58251]KJR87589.1 Rieske [2Fe-2S] domain protein [Sporothrix schenckii 1099-18]
MFNFFRTSRQRGDAAWFCAGPASAYPDIQPMDPDAVVVEVISTPRPRACGTPSSLPVAGCKIFHVSEDADTGNVTASEVLVQDVAQVEGTDALKDQVLVFQYKGQFHAVDHKCPHMSYPLSNATPFDIEDFGIVLSAGLTCPKHGWSFDMFTGMGDRGNYRLQIWEVELRDVAGNVTKATGEDVDLTDKDVWVRKKQRIG